MYISSVVQEDDKEYAAATITCLLCNHYVNNSNKVSQRLRQTFRGSLSTGYVIDSHKLDALKIGISGDPRHSKTFRNFKQTMATHLISSLHKESVKYSQVSSRKINQSHKVTKLLIAIALQLVKTGTAARHFSIYVFQVNLRVACLFF